MSERTEEDRKRIRAIVEDIREALNSATANANILRTEYPDLGLHIAFCDKSVNGAKFKFQYTCSATETITQTREY